MGLTRHVVLIHGSWGNSDIWREMAADFKSLGFVVHTPSLRFHTLAAEEAAAKLGTVSLNDYVTDLQQMVLSLSAPPLIVGHSLGGLIAQLLAVKVPHTGLVLLATAPAAGIFVNQPSSVRIFAPYFFRWAFWRKAMLPPGWKTWIKGFANEQPLEIQREYHEGLGAESGRVYFEMVLWFLDRSRAAAVRYEAVAGPVLVLAASRDQAVHPEICRRTAARYVQGRYILVEGADHLMILGRCRAAVMQHVEQWLNEFGLCCTNTLVSYPPNPAVSSAHTN